ncbi:MAG TPA: flagellar hook capping FlgD N-terminal domain-containing protein [Syntrophomonadaceae bacterium]|nr:flagellar hook capping FlgD N-terminal domain-containing protein [Syntrophomonadaceae bacterium]
MSSNAIWTSAPWDTNQNNTVNNQKAVQQDNGLLGKDDFLKILITELKYQDPLEPMDTKESIAQMASFTSLEQMQNLNKGFENMASTITNQLMPSIMLQQASNMIGREVAYINPDLDELTPEDQTVLTGVVGSVSMVDGSPIYIIGQHQVEFNNILEMGQSVDVNNNALTEILDRLDSLLDIIKPEDGEADAE